jgi:hypothetical protein
MSPRGIHDATEVLGSKALGKAPSELASNILFVYTERIEGRPTIQHPVKLPVMF